MLMQRHTVAFAVRAAAAGFILSAFGGVALAQHAVTVFGGGYARDCYEAVKKQRVTPFEALEICDTALSQERLSNSNRAATLTNRGILHMRQQRHERALQDYQAAIKLSPGMPEAKINLGAMFYYVGRYADAVTALNDGVRVEDSEARAAAYYNRAIAYEQLGNVEAAYSDYRSALAIQPDFDSAARQLERFRVVPASASSS
jgi:tetratricopeptide (TPR) repeat protein